ncbi:MAG: redoxin domain-containing protein [Chloroflexi bacterium]|nr:MAG: redoxin domain-containing protein [Chloroflexota bacterium]
MREDHQFFEKSAVQILGISVDHIWSHKAYSVSLGDLPFPLVADWHKAAARDYGVLREEEGVARRAMFLIDYRGYLRWVNPAYNVRDDDHYTALQEAVLGLPTIPRPKTKEAGSPPAS